jgi:hypothetical protein
MSLSHWAATIVTRHSRVRNGPANLGLSARNQNRGIPFLHRHMAACQQIRPTDAQRPGVRWSSSKPWRWGSRFGVRKDEWFTVEWSGSGGASLRSSRARRLDRGRIEGGRRRWCSQRKTMARETPLPNFGSWRPEQELSAGGARCRDAPFGPVGWHRGECDILTQSLI